MNQFAPLVLFVYNRLDEVRFTINALKNNQHASSCNLIIFSDQAKLESDYEKVLEVRKFIKNVSGFKTVKIIERTVNFGLARNIIEGVTEVFDKYDKVIVLEDDLLTSKNFISFMNQCLNFYENYEIVHSISGYCLPLKQVKDYPYDTFLALRPSSWGWATWKENWIDIDWEIKNYDSFKSNNVDVKRFEKGGIDLPRMLKDYVRGKNNSWAIRFAFDMFNKNKYCVYPTVSKIQNVGFGENATHCKGINIYRTTMDEGEKLDFEFENGNTLNKDILKKFKYQFSYLNKIHKRVVNYFS